MPIRHAVLFRFTDDASDEQIAALAAGLSTMPEATGAVDPDRYQHGRALGLNPGTWDYAVVAEFASPNDYETYRDHPDHQALIRDLVVPITAERASVQFDLSG
ncbi:MAG TPA: Dabb family protein [Acidimicrobiales bacterium]|nr:Dabb family protein [Acidimicrobiales bacterium]